MPLLSKSERLRQMATTKGAASAFLEDMAYIREVVAREDTSRAELRRLSVLLRRLVVNRELGEIASPRIGRIKLRALDNTFYYNAATEPGQLRLFFTGDVNIFGQYLGSLDLRSVPENELTSSITKDQVIQKLYPQGGDLERIIYLNIEQFKDQRVICGLGNWIARKDIILFMANFASGAHSAVPKGDVEFMLARIRNAVRVSKGPNGPHIHFEWEHQGPIEGARFRQAPADSVDPVLIELLGSAYALTESPDIERLEAEIQQELAQG